MSAGILLARITGSMPPRGHHDRTCSRAGVPTVRRLAGPRVLRGPSGPGRSCATGDGLAADTRGAVRTTELLLLSGLLILALIPGLRLLLAVGRVGMIREAAAVARCAESGGTACGASGTRGQTGAASPAVSSLQRAGQFSDVQGGVVSGAVPAASPPSALGTMRHGTAPPAHVAPAPSAASGGPHTEPAKQASIANVHSVAGGGVVTAAAQAAKFAPLRLPDAANDAAYRQKPPLRVVQGRHPAHTVGTAGARFPWGKLLKHVGGLGTLLAAGEHLVGDTPLRGQTLQVGGSEVRLTPQAMGPAVIADWSRPACFLGVCIPSERRREVLVPEGSTGFYYREGDQAKTPVLYQRNPADPLASALLALATSAKAEAWHGNGEVFVPDPGAAQAKRVKPEEPLRVAYAEANGECTEVWQQGSRYQLRQGPCERLPPLAATHWGNPPEIRANEARASAGNAGGNARDSSTGEDSDAERPTTMAEGGHDADRSRSGPSAGTQRHEHGSLGGSANHPRDLPGVLAGLPRADLGRLPLIRRLDAATDGLRGRGYERMELRDMDGLPVLVKISSAHLPGVAYDVSQSQNRQRVLQRTPPRTVEEFANEARWAQRASSYGNPPIGPILYGVDVTADGHYALVMEYIPGIHVASQVPRWFVPTSEMLRDVDRIEQFVREERVVPLNLQVRLDTAWDGGRGRVRVIDQEAWRSARSEADLTRGLERVASLRRQLEIRARRAIARSRGER